MRYLCTCEVCRWHIFVQLKSGKNLSIITLHYVLCINNIKEMREFMEIQVKITSKTRVVQTFHTHVESTHVYPCRVW